MEQVRTHLESQRLQYKLVERAQELGWPEPVIIDEDLGRSGSGQSERPGFSRLLRDVQDGLVGAVFSYDASRLARNNREWSQLVDYGATVKTLIIDQTAVYDPRGLDDCVLLGLKGAMSEYEVGVFRQRAQAAILEKARRGELRIGLPGGYPWTDDNRLALDPDQRVQDGIRLVFEKFRQFGSARQVAIWFRGEGIEIPVKNPKGKKNQLTWKIPTATNVVYLLKNPIYSGAYVHGRRRCSTRFVDGRPVKTIQAEARSWKNSSPKRFCMWSGRQRFKRLSERNECSNSNRVKRNKVSSTQWAKLNMKPIAASSNTTSSTRKIVSSP